MKPSNGMGPAGRLVFHSKNHLYLLDGNPLPSNTEIITATGMIDTRFFTPESRDRGTAVHQACHFLCENDLDWSTVNPAYMPYVEACADFLTKTGFKPERNEFPVWSKYGYATTPDVLGVLAGHRVLINFKTGVCSKWVGLQLTGEKIAVNERIEAQDEPWTADLPYLNGHPYPEQLYGLELKSNGKWKLVPYNDEDLTEDYLAMVRFHHWKQRNGYGKEK